VSLPCILRHVFTLEKCVPEHLCLHMLARVALVARVPSTMMLYGRIDSKYTISTFSSNFISSKYTWACLQGWRSSRADVAVDTCSAAHMPSPPRSLRRRSRPTEGRTFPPVHPAPPCPTRPLCPPAKPRGAARGQGSERGRERISSAIGQTPQEVSPRARCRTAAASGALMRLCPSRPPRAPSRGTVWAMGFCSSGTTVNGAACAACASAVLPPLRVFSTPIARPTSLLLLRASLSSALCDAREIILAKCVNF
jgi:hypothetical protein